MLYNTAILVAFLAAAITANVQPGQLLPRDKHLPPQISAVLHHHNSSGPKFFTRGQDKAAAFFRGGNFNISGFVSFEYLASSNATEVRAELTGFSTELMQLANGQGFLYHIHEFPVPSDGNCSATGGHLDPTNYTEARPCVPPQVTPVISIHKRQLDGTLGNLNASFTSLQHSLPILTNLTGPLEVSTPVSSPSAAASATSTSSSVNASSSPLQQCQEGDLSGYGGKLRPVSGAVNTSFQDIYLQWTGPASAIILEKSVVIHLPNKTRIACANITAVQVNGSVNSTVLVNATVSSSLSSSSGTAPSPPTSSASKIFSPFLYLVILAILCSA